MRFTSSVVRKSIFALASSALLLSTMAWAADDSKSDIDKRLDNSAEVLTQIMGTPDKGIPTKVLDSAQCVAVVPSMIKIAVGFGGRHGKGVATCRTAHGWSAPAPITITGGSWGLQIGGEAIDLVMLVMNEDGMNNLLSSKFKIGADASAAAGPVGRQAAGSTDWKMRAQILTYSRARGIFAGISLDGAVVTQGKDDTRAFYGRMVPFKTLLTGELAAPEDAKPFISSLDKHILAASVKK